MLSVPPRHTKSMTFSELLPPFFFGNYPNQRIIHISYDQGLVEGFGVKIRETMNSPEYQDLFPNVEIPAVDYGELQKAIEESIST